MGSRAGSVRDPNAAAADLDNINLHSPDMIERERHFAQIRVELERQFKEIDSDHSG